MTIGATCSTENNRTGNGRYTPLPRKKRDNQEQEQEQQKKQKLKDKLDAIDKKNTRMRFRNSRDPVFVAFDHLEKQSLKRLAAEFFKDSINDFIFFVTKLN